ncbi:serine hydrolase [Chryseolinea sp. T2]|uniref:serine hydrolase domain-containing protein n=1 Tax=Chryseolinea sp. T2 TaxID=3129255 RepID=UPI00307712DF
MKVFLIFPFILLIGNSCNKIPEQWNGKRLSRKRDQITVAQLQTDNTLALVDLSYYARPDWAGNAGYHFSGSIVVGDTQLNYPRGGEPYDGEDTFPAITMDFIADGTQLIPVQKGLVVATKHTNSFWDVIIGTGAVWNEDGDNGWSRASFPLTLTDRYVGQARNCVATFVYNSITVSNVCVQCSQETASLEDHRVGDIRVMLKANYQPKRYVDSAQVIQQHHQSGERRLPVYPLRDIDAHQEVAEYFDRTMSTNSPTSIGAVLAGGKLYLHPPKTRHGLYPYPADMRHGVYSVTKSMAGALALMYFAQRYSPDIFDELITDHVPALANHAGWKGVTFSHALNMVTGTVGSEDMEHILDFIKARTAEESINVIAKLGDAPSLPGQEFNYASTNFFVLSYALQNYVNGKEGTKADYWDLVRENVLVPIGAEDLTLRRTVEEDNSLGIPVLAYGAFPTLDEAAKIAMLFYSEGNYNGQQLLHRQKTREALGRTQWVGHSTGNDSGENYRHSFWSTTVHNGNCTVNATYMWGYGGNYIIFLPNDVIAFRFMDEYDLNVHELVRKVEQHRACP